MSKIVEKSRILSLGSFFCAIRLANFVEIVYNRRIRIRLRRCSKPRNVENLAGGGNNFAYLKICSATAE